ncbi:MAG: hypothetical protein JWN78_2928 [Bacteroidota bacterium]|nr:hypothetical protein [Bacteroidota bacterium]
MKNNRLLYILGVITIVAIIVAIVLAKNKKNSGGKEVEIQSLTKRDIIQTVTASGKIYPEEEVKISSDVSGEIIELTVQEGDVVKKGQLLARIKPESYQANVEQSEAQLDNTRAQLSTAKSRIVQVEAQYESAQTQFARSEGLYQKKIISKSDYETAETAVKTAKAELEAAKHSADAADFTIKATQAMIKEAKINLNKTTIYAPMDGIISLLNVKKGEKVVGTLQMSGTEMMRIANFENMEVRVDVSEGEITKVKLNDTASIEVDAYLDRKFDGLVTQVSNTSKGASSLMTSSDQSTNFIVKIRILKSSYQDLLADNPKPFLPGMSATVDVKTKKKDDVLSVPIQSVTTKDSVYNGTNHTKEIVFVYDNGKARTKEVKTGIQDDTYIEITEGLSGNEKIITGPYNTISKDLKDGDAVKEMDKNKKKAVPEKKDDKEETK